jgi:hypothetical protein
MNTGRYYLLARMAHIPLCHVVRGSHCPHLPVDLMSQGRRKSPKTVKVHQGDLYPAGSDRRLPVGEGYRPTGDRYRLGRGPAWKRNTV